MHYVLLFILPVSVVGLCIVVVVIAHKVFEKKKEKGEKKDHRSGS